MCHILSFLLKDYYFVDVAKIIFYEIYKFVKLEVNQNNQKAKGSLPCFDNCSLYSSWWWKKAKLKPNN